MPVPPSRPTINGSVNGRWQGHATNPVTANTQPQTLLIIDPLLHRNKNGKPASTILGSACRADRSTDEWIEVHDACPRIIDEDTWQGVQNILSDPERAKQLPTPRFYMLRGRAKCAVCGSAMVGQTLTVKGRPFRYYRCRHGG